MTQTNAVALQHFDNRQIEIMRRTVAKDTSPEEFALFLEVCKYRGLNPLNREIYAIVRQGKMTIQTGIDGLRKLAERSGKYRGQMGPYFCGEDGVWKEEWLLKSPPVAAKVGILRSDFDQPVWAIARYDAYVQTTKDGKVTEMWAKFHDVLLAKCAESLAIRKTFPYECSGMYTNEEMSQADNRENMTVESIAPNSQRLNALYAKGKEKGLWSDQNGFYTFVSVVTGFNVTRETIYDLVEDQFLQLEQAIDEEPALAS